MSRRSLDQSSADCLETLLNPRKRVRASSGTSQAESSGAAAGAAPAVRHEDAEQGEAEEEDMQDEEGEEDEEWEDAFEVGRFTQLDAGFDVDVTVDAPAVPEPGSSLARAVDGDGDGEAGASRSVQSEEVQRVEQAELRRLKRQHNAQRRQAADASHRVALLCWLGHGRQLSDQADDEEVQGWLLSLLPAPLAALSDAPALADLDRLAHWLHAYLRDAAPSAAPDVAPAGGAARGRGRGRGSARGHNARGGGGSAHGSSGGGGDDATERGTAYGWALCHVSLLGWGKDAPAWAEAAADPCARLLLRGCSGNGDDTTACLALTNPRPPRLFPEAGAAPFFLAPSAPSTPSAPASAAHHNQLRAVAAAVEGTSGAGVPSDGGALRATKALVHARASGSQSAAGAPPLAPSLAPPSRAALWEALVSRAGTPAQRTLLTLALYRATGRSARLVVALQPPPTKPPPTGKAYPTPPEPPTGAPHVPMWCEVRCETATQQRWVAIDPSHPGQMHVDAPEAIIDRRVPSKVAQARRAGGVSARAYVVAYSHGEVRDVTPRYVANVAAMHAARTDGAWWEAALRAVHADCGGGAVPGGGAACRGSSRGGGGGGTRGLPSAVAIDVDAEDDDEVMVAGDDDGDAGETGPAAAGATGAVGATGVARAGVGTGSGAGVGAARVGASGVSAAAAAAAGTMAAAEAAAAAEAEAAEAAEMRRREASQPLPTSLAEYRRHPLYILQRDVRSTQAIHPPSTRPVGLCKGQRVYLRTHVYELRSEQAWFRRGFELRPGAIEAPARMAQRGQKASDARAAQAAQAAQAAAAEGEAPLDAADGRDAGPDGTGAAAPSTAWYGEWQVQPYVPPRAVGGVVPRSSHGHVELWSEHHLPRGTVHLREPHVAQAAKMLSFDAARAMVGFDVQQGRPVPKFEGVVVCVEHAALLREAAAAMQQQSEDDRARSQHATVLGLWRKLLNALAVRRRLEQQYGGGSGSGR